MSLRSDQNASAIASAGGHDRPGLAMFALACVLVGGAALRFWNLTTGLPYKVAVDEPVIAERAIHMMRSGDFNPHFFDYPGFYIYVQMVVGCVRFVTGAMDGLWRSLDQFWAEQLFPWTRALNAVLGTATLLLVYRAGFRWGRWVAVLAAGLLAVWPNHVRESHFALTDVPLTFLTTLALVLSLRALESAQLRWLAAAGVSVGLAAATKYNGAVAIVMPLAAAAACAAPRADKAWRVTVAIAAAVGAYGLAAPYTFLDLPAFLNAFGYLTNAYSPRSFVSGALIYLGHLRVAVGPLGVVVVGFGIVWSLARALRDRGLATWALIMIFPVVFFNMIATKDLIYGRYLLPITPFLCLFMAIVVVDVLGWIFRLRQPLWVRSIAGAAFASFALAHIVSAGLVWPRDHGKRTTADVAYRMIRSFIPDGSRVAVENSVLRLPDSVYRSVNVPNLTRQSTHEYVAAGVTFVIASSDVFGPVFARPDEHPEAHQAYRWLLDEAECLPTVEPTPAVPGPAIRICRLRTD